jgi:hypothetical protein
LSNAPSYQIKLDQFEGPFDLLLFFIERDELDIYNIPITKITNEFLDHIHVTEKLNIELSSEFILFISTLMRIKAKMLLPRKEIDADGNEIGTANIDIEGVTTTYQFIQTPIQYTSNATPAYMYIRFIMAKEGTNPTFGSRLIIDNVVTNLAALAINTNLTNSDVSIFPTLVEDKLFIDGNGQFDDTLDYKIINLEGKVVSQNSIKEDSISLFSIEVGSLNSGIYLLNVTTSNGQFTKKFVKK